MKIILLKPSKRPTRGMGLQSILWTIIIGICGRPDRKVLHPGNKNEPSGFILTRPPESREHLLRRILAKRSGGTKLGKVLVSSEESLVQS
jgi:hypothetical protein